MLHVQRAPNPEVLLVFLAEDQLNVALRRQVCWGEVRRDGLGCGRGLVFVSQDHWQYEVGQHRDGAVGHGAGYDLKHQCIVDLWRSVLQSRIGASQGDVGDGPEEGAVLALDGDERADLDVFDGGARV